MAVQWISLKYEYIAKTITHFFPVTNDFCSLPYWFQKNNFACSVYTIHNYTDFSWEFDNRAAVNSFKTQEEVERPDI